MRHRTVGVLVEAWAQAERRGDVTLLSTLLDDGFVGVTGTGHTLDKSAWIGQYRSGALVHHAYCWRTVATRVDDSCAFVIGRVDHASSYLGRDASGRRTITLTATARGGAWHVAGLHAS